MFRRELLSKIPDGTYVWEDYAEHDGVDPPRLHAQRMTLTKSDGQRLVIDFAGTSPQAKGPINHAGNYADGVFLKKWIAPILRNLADTPERMAELDVNEGVVPLIELRFPPPGTPAHPDLPGAHQRPHLRHPATAGHPGRRPGQGDRRQDARRPGDDPLHGFHGTDDERPAVPDARGAGRRLGGRPWADGSDTIHVVPDSKNLPVEFTETRFPLRVEHLALAPDSGGPGKRRGGLGYRKEIRVLRDAAFLSVADRSILSCWGLKGGQAGKPFRVTVDPGGPNAARPRRARRRRATAGGHPGAHRHDRRRRLGRSAGARARAGRARREPGQGQPSASARDDYGVVLGLGLRG